MEKHSRTFLKLMEVFAGIAMVGYAIEAGSKIIATIVSMYNPVGAHNLYIGLDMSPVYAYSKSYFVMAMSMLIAIPMLKSAIWWAVIVMLRKLDLDNPFSQDFTSGFGKSGQFVKRNCDFECNCQYLVKMARKDSWAF